MANRKLAEVLLSDHDIIIDSEGIKLQDSNWNDITFPTIGANIDTVSGRLDYNFEEAVLDFAANARYPQEPVVGVAQMRHSKLLGSQVHPHLHWYQEENQVPNWLLAYRFYNNGDLVPAWSLAKYTTHAFTYVSGTLFQLTLFPALNAPSPENVSACYDFRLYRDSANTSGLFAGVDPYSVAAGVKQFDLHIELDTVGSPEEFSK